MNITSLEVEGFGIWTGLKLDPVGEGLTVFCGPNEAGKTTLLQFIRSALYGYSPERRRYLPPVHGGRPGGSLSLDTPNGGFTVSRYLDADAGGDREVLFVADSDGVLQSDDLLCTLLCHVDEKIFNNVFAVGLREIQELGTLKETEAAALLYNLTVGLDRVSLVEVMRELGASRNRLWDGSGRPCCIAQLLGEREKIRAELGDPGGPARRYAGLVEERGHLDRDVARLEEENRRLGREVRLLDLALALRERWQKRKVLDEQWAALGPAERMPEGAAERFDAFQAAVEKRERVLHRVKAQWAKLRDEARGLGINESLVRQAPRVQALQEQAEWIAALETRVLELETEVAGDEAHWKEERSRLGLGDGAVPTLSARSLAALRRPARALHHCRQRVAEARQEVQRCEETARSLGEQIDSSLSARGHRDLGEATDRTGGVVAQLRRRAQIEERLVQMDRHEAELGQQGRALLDREILPVSVILGLGSLFVLGIVLVLLKLWEFVGETSLLGDLGWPLALLGLTATAAAVVTKFLLEHSNARQIEHCQRQLRLLQLQRKQTKEDRDNLDRQLPRGSEPAAGRLQTAERELAGLEELVPLDAQRHAARQEAEAAGARAKDAEGDLAAALRRWKEAIAAAGLPDGLSPRQVRELFTRCEQLTELEGRLQKRRDELKERSAELEGLTGRVEQLAREVQLGAAAKTPLEKLGAIAEELAQQQARLKRRRVLARQGQQLRRKYARLGAAVARLKHRRRILLDEVGTRDEVEFRRRAVSQQQAESVRREREAVRREIDAAIAGYASEEEIGPLVEGGAPERLHDRRQELQARETAGETLLKQRLEKRGQLNEQLKTLAENRTPAARRFELGIVEKRLEEAIHEWRVLAVTGRVLEDVRRTYEKTRQPESLQEASGYLERMTGGRYRRVWTPLSEDVLLVDDAGGKPLPVELLSHGAREQLFLCLRLALAGSYARRGAALPLVLDDVLVNFDGARARAAAGVLRDFAAEGHQLLVFTCHDHIARLFDDLGVEIKQLPDHAEGHPGARARHGDRRPRRRKVRPVENPYTVVAESDAPEPPRPAAAVEASAVGTEPPESLDPLAPWEEDDTDTEEAASPDGDFDDEDEEPAEGEEDEEEPEDEEEMIAAEDAGETEPVDATEPAEGRAGEADAA